MNYSAFCHFTFRAPDGSKQETIYNMTEKEIPTSILHQDGVTILLLDVLSDAPAPDYIPQPGERFFGMITEKRAEMLATKDINSGWDRTDNVGVMLRTMYPTKKKAITALADAYYGKGDNFTLFTVPPSGYSPD